MRSLCIAVTLAAVTISATQEPRKGVPLDILSPHKLDYGALRVLDADLMFVVLHTKSGGTPTQPGAPRLPDFSSCFVWDGEFLRVKMQPLSVDNKTNVKGTFSGALLAKDRWYVTADYSTKPPRVVLTQQPTKYSRWSWDNVPRGNGHFRESADYYIKNENDLGKDAWLAAEKEGKTYHGGIARKPILSYEKKILFDVVDVNESEDGK
jgi:hypothetical protein